jgi:hypothetical protein|tara:strand:- start:941 stop:1462 length:522 start_codon:yes stop_codon:yes gene_type:complete
VAKVPTPTPYKGDINCAISVCLMIIAQVECIVIIMQGTTACIDIQFFNKEGKPLNLDRFDEIKILLFNELECAVAEFCYPEPLGSTCFPLEILQYTTTDGTIHNKGLIRICLTKECTSLTLGALFAEILLTENETGAASDITGISCLKVAEVIPSRILNLGDPLCKASDGEHT